MIDDADYVNSQLDASRQRKEGSLPRRFTSSTPATSLISVSEAMGCVLADVSKVTGDAHKTHNSNLACRTEASSRNNNGFAVPKLTLQAVVNLTLGSSYREAYRCSCI